MLCPGVNAVRSTRACACSIPVMCICCFTVVCRSWCLWRPSLTAVTAAVAPAGTRQVWYALGIFLASPFLAFLALRPPPEKQPNKSTVSWHTHARPPPPKTPPSTYRLYCTHTSGSITESPTEHILRGMATAVERLCCSSTGHMSSSIKQWHLQQRQRWAAEIPLQPTA